MSAAGTLGGLKRGRPPGLSREQIEQIITQRREGSNLTQIAIKLNARGVPMPGGGSHWGKQSVKRVLSTRYAQDIAAEMSP